MLISTIIEFIEYYADILVEILVIERSSLSPDP